MYRSPMKNLPIIFTIFGGPDIIVEIDEKFFGKMKYHMGRSIDDQWVVGGVERTPEKSAFL